MSALLTPLPCPNPKPIDQALPFAVPPLAALSFPCPPAPLHTARAATPPFPQFPHPAETHAFPASWPSPLTVFPSVIDFPKPEPKPAPTHSPAPFDPGHFAAPPEPLADKITQLAAQRPTLIFKPAPPDTTHDTTPPEPARNAPQKPRPADFTDADLREALQPSIELALRRVFYADENGIDTRLEPMLRSTIRRALAEYSPLTRPFEAPGPLDRMLWRLQALFTSRTYEDIVFDKTRRFQVEEVFLLDRRTLALISFASCDPARHASARRVDGTVQRLALRLRDDSGTLSTTFDLNEGRTAVVREGGCTYLVAVLRGQPNELAFADLEFALRRVEDRFRPRLEDGGAPLLHVLQPFLEDCLLIQAPASAA